MLKTVLLVTLLCGLFAAPAAAQEPCDVSTIVDSLASSEDLDTLRAALVAALQQVDDCTPADAGTTRSNPVPLGEGYTFPEGVLHVTGTEVVTPQGYSNEFLQITLQWDCVQTDENATCKGAVPTYYADFVTAGGEVVDGVGVYPDEYIGNFEVYSGATITGTMYFEPQDTSGALLRLQLDGEPVFFALE